MSASHFEMRQKRQEQHMKKMKKSRNRTRAEVFGAYWDLAQQLITGEANPRDWFGEDDVEETLWGDIGFDFPYGRGSDGLSLAAEKAVASAAVHCLMGLPATDLSITEDYVSCGKSEVDMTARVNGMRQVAGYSWGNRKRIGVNEFAVNPNSRELENAREVVWTFMDEKSSLLFKDGFIARNDGSKDRAINAVLSDWVLKVGNMLREYVDFIQRVARLLVKKGRLSAKQFAFWMRHARIWKEKREKRFGAGGFDPSNN